MPRGKVDDRFTCKLMASLNLMAAKTACQRCVLAFVSVAALVPATRLSAQTGLNLSSAVAAPGSTVVLNLSLTTSGDAPAALEWTLAYPANQISAIGGFAGPVATAAGKTLTCASGPGTMTCILAGMNVSAMASGVAATIQATLAPNARTTTIALTSAIGADATAANLAVATGASGVITVPAVSALSCNPASLGQSAVSSCTVTLTQPALAGGNSVALASNNALLTVPASVVVAAAATTATFNATAAAVIASNQNAIVTATYNSISQSAAIALQAPVLVSALSCNPASIGQSAVSSCTVTLSQPALAGGATVALASNNALLTVPASVVVAAAATTATFNASAAAAIASNQNANVTATYNSTSQSAAIALQAPLLVSALSCNPASLGQSAVSSCTVTLTQPALAGGATVALASNNALLTVPASVVVAAAATTATFNATAAAAIASNQNATVTASYNSTSQTATIALQTPVLVSALSCNPASLGQSAVSSCTVTLTQPALAGGATVALASNNALLTVPASVVVAAAATTATFNASAAAAIASNQNANVTATYNSTSQTATIALQAALVSALSCSPKGSLAGGSTICTVTLSQPVSAATNVSLSSNSLLLSIPAIVTVPAGSAVAGATATAGAVTADSVATVIATLGASSQSVKVPLWPNPTVTSLVCNPATISAGSSTTCNVTLSMGTGTVEPVNITSSSPALSSPGTVTVQAGTPTAMFAAQATAAVGAVTLTASYNGTRASANITIQASSPTSAARGAESGSSRPKGTDRVASIACKPISTLVRTKAVCRVDLARLSEASDPEELNLSSSDESLKLPATSTIQPGQTTAKFMVEASSPSAVSAVITARLGDEMVQDTLSLDGEPTQLRVPRRVYARYGATVQFRVISSAPVESLRVTGLPPAAVFDSDSGLFQWTPDVAQQGAHQVVFSATTVAGGQTLATSEIEVGPGVPAIVKVVNGASRSKDNACSPGAIGSLEGRWLAESDANADSTGGSTKLSGTSVTVNGAIVPILAATPTRVDFLCPNVSPETTLEIGVQTSYGVSPPVQTLSKQAAPGIFSIDSIDGTGQGQGAIVHSGTSTMAMIHNYRYASEAAFPGEPVTIYATGITAQDEISIFVGQTELRPQSVLPVPGMAGVYELGVTLPWVLPDGEEVITLSVRMPDGRATSSNEVQFATQTGSHLRPADRSSSLAVPPE